MKHELEIAALHLVSNRTCVFKVTFLESAKRGMNYQQRSQGQPLKRVGLLLLIFSTLCFFQRTVRDGHRSLRALTTVQEKEEKASFYEPGLDDGSVPETSMPSPEGTVPPPTPEPTSPEPTLEPSVTITLEPTSVSSDLHHPEKVIDILHEESLQKVGILRQEILATTNNVTSNATVILAEEQERETKLHTCDEPVSEEWLPPANATQEDIDTWTNAVAKSLDRIRASNLGGDPLRSLGKDEMGKLGALRDDLFCGRDA